MKILVLGAGGMAGHVIALSLKEKGHSVTGLARRNLFFCDTITGDAGDVEMIKNLCSRNFDAIINAIGILPVEINVNLYNGVWLNSCLPHLLVKLNENNKTRIIHMSTDCVFSGHDNGGYDEKSFCSADDYYGRSKHLGELNDNKNLTFRMSIIGPDINESGVGLFNWFMKQNSEATGFRRAIWTGVTTITLADAIDAALEQELTGLYHLVNNDVINKYELLKLFNRLKVEPITIIPSDDYDVDKSMVNTRKDFQFDVPTYSDMICGIKEWIKKHREFYPQYNCVETVF